MEFIAEVVFSGFVSKAVNNCVDVSWNKIKEAVKNGNTKHKNLESQIYNISVDVLNKITENQYENNPNKIYDAAEVLLKSFKENDVNELGNIKACLRFLDLSADENKCLKFKRSLYEELSREEYGELFRAILLLLLDQKSKYDNAVYEQLIQKLNEVILILNGKKDDAENNIKKKVKSRTQEYADKWNQNMFLNNFDKRDQNAGTNIKLSEVYLEEHLPQYIWGENQNKSTDLKDLLKEYIYQHNGNKMLLILGQPGIGKSTLITWITANFSDRIDDILVYRYASDLANIDWQNVNISNRVLEELSLNHSDLNGKTLIIDGFDEVSIESNRRSDILDSLYGDWINNRTINNFSLIITCRENYITKFAILKCKYIILQPWDDIQIKSFCKIFQEIIKNDIAENTIEKLLQNREILGIPLILYMVLALNISIEKEGSIVDIYDKIFSLTGGIYDRCINNKYFAENHRIAEIKEQIHQISRDIAMWMFENDPDEANIPQGEYEKICNTVMKEQPEEIKQDFIIGNFFKRIKHCEGIGVDKICFIHRSIYEYFVAETIYSSVEGAMIKLTEDSQEELAGNIAWYLKEGQITYIIGKYLYYKIIKLYDVLEDEKKQRFYQWWESAVGKMMNVGMFYYTNLKMKSYVNIINKECQCFINLVEILRLLLSTAKRKYIMEDTNKIDVRRYIRYCCMEFERKRLNFSKMYLLGINLSDTDLSNVNLSETCFRRADLRGAILELSDLKGADLRGAFIEEIIRLFDRKLNDVDLCKADMTGAILDVSQVYYLKNKYNLLGTKVYVEETGEVIDYEKYITKKQSEVFK